MKVKWMLNTASAVGRCISGNKALMVNVMSANSSINT